MTYTFHPLSTDYEWEWLYERAKPALCDDTKGIVAYRGNDIVAAVCFDSWSYNATNSHIAIDDPMVIRNGFLEELFYYVFQTADKGILIGMIPGNNEKMLRFAKHVGLEEIYRIKDGYMVGIDYVALEVRRENCRYGQKRHSAAA